MKNPFRFLTLPEKISTIRRDKLEELLHAELTIIEAAGRADIARNKLRALATFEREHLDLHRPGLPLEGENPTPPQSRGIPLRRVSAG